MFGHSMFGVFEVRYFGVRSKTSSYEVDHTDFSQTYADGSGKVFNIFVTNLATS